MARSAKKKAANKPRSAKPVATPIRDLRDWLKRVEDIGELLRISEPVDTEEEMSAVSYLVAKQTPSPAILFDNPLGFENDRVGASLLWNILGPSLRRVALTFEESPDTHAVELIRRVKDKLKQRIPPREVPRATAPLYENTLTGKDIDLRKLPIPKHWPLDGGRYAGTADAVITRDPDSGYLNVGTYRMMIQGKREAGLYLSPGKDARLHINRAWQKGEAIHVAAAWGIDPLFMVVGSQTFAKNVSEYEFAGGIKGEAVPVVRALHSDLLLPANAELVIEGIIRPGSVKTEGPFGEFTGYYAGGKSEQPVIRVQRVYYRDNPIITMATPMKPPSDFSYSKCVMKAGMIWDEVERAGLSGVQGVWCHEAGGARMFNVISIKQAYGGHARQAGMLAASCQSGSYLGRFVVVVDEDIDPTNLFEVTWAMCTRCDPSEDIEFIRKAWSGPLDPRIPRGTTTNSRAVIMACRPWERLDDFPPVAEASPELREKVAAKFSDILAKLG